MASAVALRIDDAVGELVADHGSDRQPESFEKYDSDPVGFIEVEPGFKLMPKQKEICRSVVEHKRTVVRGAHGVGKDAVSGPLAIWAAYCRGMLVLCVSATERQLLGQLWKEVSNRWLAGGDRLGGQLFTSDLRIDGEKRIICMTSNNISSLTGWHDPKGVFVIISEAQGESTEANAFDAAEMNCVDSLSRMLVLGNPSKSSGRFYDVHQRQGWNQIRFSMFDHQNIQDGKETILGGPAPDSPAQIAEQYGIGSAFYIGRVLAEFSSEGSIDSVFEAAWIDEAVAKWRNNHFAEKASKHRRRIVSDVAKGGDDTCIGVIRGPIIETLESFKERDLMSLADRLHTQSLSIAFGNVGRVRPTETELMKNRCRITVDDLGVGAGVTSRLLQLGLDVTAFNAGAPAENKERFKNRRAETHFLLRDDLLHGRIALPPDAELREELLATSYILDSTGKLQIESKELLRTKLKRSPDRSDVVTMSREPDRSWSTWKYQLSY